MCTKGIKNAQASVRCMIDPVVDWLHSYWLVISDPDFLWFMLGFSYWACLYYVVPMYDVGMFWLLHAGSSVLWLTSDGSDSFLVCVWKKIPFKICFFLNGIMRTFQFFPVTQACAFILGFTILKCVISALVSHHNTRLLAARRIRQAEYERARRMDDAEDEGLCDGVDDDGGVV
jgi:hypothetical protein